MKKLILVFVLAVLATGCDLPTGDQVKANSFDQEAETPSEKMDLEKMFQEEGEKIFASEYTELLNLRDEIALNIYTGNVVELSDPEQFYQGALGGIDSIILEKYEETAPLLGDGSRPYRVNYTEFNVYSDDAGQMLSFIARSIMALQKSINEDNATKYAAQEIKGLNGLVYTFLNKQRHEVLNLSLLFDKTEYRKTNSIADLMAARDEAASNIYAGTYKRNIKTIPQDYLNQFDELIMAHGDFSPENSYFGEGSSPYRVDYAEFMEIHEKRFGGLDMYKFLLSNLKALRVSIIDKSATPYALSEFKFFKEYLDKLTDAFIEDAGSKNVPSNIAIQTDPIRGYPYESARKLIDSSDCLYEIYHDGVFFHGIRLLDVDVETIELVDDDYMRWAKDKNHIYFEGEMIVGATPENFTYLKDEWASYDDTVLWGSKVVKGADRQSFEIMTGDETSVYWAKDQNNVYYQGQKLEGADSATFEYLGYYLAKDKINAYFYGRELRGADAATVQALNYKTSKDKTNVYSQGEIIEGADPTTYELIQGERIDEFNKWAKDKSNLFYGEKALVIDGLDLASLEYVSDRQIKDKNHTYTYSGLIVE